MSSSRKDAPQFNPNFIQLLDFIKQKKSYESIELINFMTPVALSALDGQNKTLLHWAFENRMIEVCLLLISKMNMHSLNHNSIIIDAFYAREYNIVDALIPYTSESNLRKIFSRVSRFIRTGLSYDREYSIYCNIKKIIYSQEEREREAITRQKKYLMEQMELEEIARQKREQIKIQKIEEMTHASTNSLKLSSCTHECTWWWIFKCVVCAGWWIFKCIICVGWWIFKCYWIFINKVDKYYFNL
jgi:hypothetical protein